MKLDILTISFVLGLVFLTQVIALGVQYRINKIYKGIRYWLLGSAFMMLGFLLLAAYNMPQIRILSALGNPAIVMGQIMFLVGVLKFLGQKVKKGPLAGLYVSFFAAYMYYLFIDYHITARTVIISGACGLLSLMTAYVLFTKKDKQLAQSANFVASIFTFNGLFLLMRLVMTLIAPPMADHSNPALIQVLAYIVLIATGSLWTFGFILMVNQRHNRDHLSEKEKLETVFNTSPDAIIFTNLKAEILMASAMTGQLFGYTQEALIGKSLLSLIDKGDHLRAEERLSAKRHVPASCAEYKAVRRDGSGFDIEIKSSYIYDEAGKANKRVFVIRDISERKQAEHKIQSLVRQLEDEKNAAELNSITDGLTGLLNRRYFDEALASEFFRLNRTNDCLSLIMFDVDHFKKYNDTYGHLAGDDCLKLIAKTLKSVVSRRFDVIARFGGEEFVIILPETDRAGAQKLAEKIRVAIERLAIPHSSSETAPYITISLGVVTVRSKQLEHREQIIALADKAMYDAKEKGRNCLVVSKVLDLRKSRRPEGH